MRRSHPFIVAIVVLACAPFLACSEPSKPIKKLNIKRASDLELIAAPMATNTDAPAKEDAAAAPAATESMEIVEVEGFRGQCDSTFTGINDEDLVTVRSATQVRTHRLAGISIPADVRLDAQNQLRIWMDGKNISVEVDDCVPALDAPAYLHLCDGRMVNEELVRAGLAVPSEARFRRTDARMTVSTLPQHHCQRGEAPCLHR